METWKSVARILESMDSAASVFFALTSQVCGMYSIINIINNNGIYYYSFFHGGREQGFGDNKLDNLGQGQGQGQHEEDNWLHYIGVNGY